MVKKGERATVKNEKYIIAEENTSIDYNGHTYSVMDIPIGQKKGVIDARVWMIDNKKYDAKYESNGVTFIATGSPALQSWKDILK